MTSGTCSSFMTRTPTKHSELMATNAAIRRHLEEGNRKNWRMTMISRNMKL